MPLNQARPFWFHFEYKACHLPLVCYITVRNGVWCAPHDSWRQNLWLIRITSFCLWRTHTRPDLIISRVLSISTMPVVRSKLKAEEPGEVTVGPPLNGNKIKQSLDAFRNHHEDCAERRKNGLSLEIKIEAHHSEWLRKKYLESLGQQQALAGPGRLESASRSQLSSFSDSADIMVSWHDITS